jgi:hypothetical protein
MERVQFDEDGISIDAAIIAEDLGIEPSAVPRRIREGSLTCLCERGVDEDAGRYRLSFFHSSRRLRLIVDGEGRVIRRSLLDFGDRPLPRSARVAGVPRPRRPLATPT